MVETIITIALAIVGSSALSALVTGLLSSCKCKSESNKIATEADQIKSHTQLDEIEFINKRLQEISEKARLESDELTKRNTELAEKVTDLNNKLQLIMEWVIYDNQKYRQWLETELRKVNPTLIFPECPPPPKIFQRDEH